FHGVADLQGGSFSTAAGFFSGQYMRGRATVGASVEAMRTDRYLDPPVEENYTNGGSGAGFSLRSEAAWRDADRTRIYAHRRRTDFHVPNDALQESAGQRQTRASAETLVQASHQHVFSDHLLGHAALMARTTSATLESNEASTPIRPAQDRGFDDLYLTASLTANRGVHELKVGGEATAGSVRERFASATTAYTVDGVPVFDPDLPATFAFAAKRPLREQAAYLQDLIRAGRATMSAGLRFDRYRLAVRDWALSPRLSASWFVPRARLVVHGSYDRTFETP